MPKTLDARTLMEKLIAFPIGSSDSNLNLVDFVESYLRQHGISSTRVPDATEAKDALYAHVEPLIEGGMVFSGHTDVMICGPGDIAQAHQPNEYITIEQFKEGEAFMERLLGAFV